MNGWFDHRLEMDPRFLDGIAAARAILRPGQAYGWRMLTTHARRTKRRSRVVPRGEFGLRPRRRVVAVRGEIRSLYRYEALDRGPA